MALLILPDGKDRSIVPPNNAARFSDTDLRRILHGDVEPRRINHPNGMLMYISQRDQKDRELERINLRASDLVGDTLYGYALICNHTERTK